MGLAMSLGKMEKVYLLDTAEVCTKCTILKSDWSDIRPCLQRHVIELSPFRRMKLKTEVYVTLSYQESALTRRMNGKNASRMMNPSLQQLAKTTIEEMAKNRGFSRSWLFVFPTSKFPSQVICLSRGGMNISVYSPTLEKTRDRNCCQQGRKSGGIHKNWLNIDFTSRDTLIGQRGPIDFKNDGSHWKTVETTESVLITGVQMLQETNTREPNDRNFCLGRQTKFFTLLIT